MEGRVRTESYRRPLQGRGCPTQAAKPPKTSRFFLQRQALLFCCLRLSVKTTSETDTSKDHSGSLRSSSSRKKIAMQLASPEPGGISSTWKQTLISFSPSNLSLKTISSPSGPPGLSSVMVPAFVPERRILQWNRRRLLRLTHPTRRRVPCSSGPKCLPCSSGPFGPHS